MCGRSHRGCYHINCSYFPRQKFVWVYVLLYFSFLGPHPSGQTNFMRGWVFFFFFFFLVIWFSAEHVFPNHSIVHYIPAYSLSLLLNYHQYIICFVFESPTVRSIIRYLVDLENKCVSYIVRFSRWVSMVLHQQYVHDFLITQPYFL